MPAASGLQTVRDPYTGDEVYVAPALRPDWAVLHVHEADALGNARIYGSVFWDRLMSRAARGVILTAERIVPTEELARQPELTLIPGFLVSTVVHVPGGAWPGSCYPEYDYDAEAVREYMESASDPAALRAYLERCDRAPGIGRRVPGAGAARAGAVP